MEPATRIAARSFAASVARLEAMLVLASVMFAPSANAGVVINEFNSGTPDFLELRNPTSAPIDVSGFTVRTWVRLSAAGALSAETPFVIPAGTLLGPKDYLVLQEAGTKNKPGTLPKSISVGFNYNWTSTQTVEIALFDAMSTGVDYAYFDSYKLGPTGNLPAGLVWSGTISGTGDDEARDGDVDTDDASDWTKSAGKGTPGALNPGQHDCALPIAYGSGCSGSDAFTPALSMSGCVTPQTPVVLTVQSALGGSIAHMVVGASGAEIPVGACMLQVDPAFVFSVPLGGHGPGGGNVSLYAMVPADASGASIAVQAFVHDPGVPLGLASSNALRIDVE